MRIPLSLGRLVAVGIAAVAISRGAQAAGAQGAGVGASPTPPPAARGTSAPLEATPPPDYVIGVDDQLAVVFFQNKDASTDVVVRPDGKISLPLLNDVQASGLTPEQLRGEVTKLARKFFQDPNPAIIVRQINSRRVFITGNVEKPGNYPLLGTTTVLQLIATAGGLNEEADARKIVIMRDDRGRQATFGFNYKDVVSQKNLQQNIALRPGDIVVVP
jgi:polysaccharide export outer membrane protein